MELNKVYILNVGDLAKTLPPETKLRVVGAHMQPPGLKQSQEVPIQGLVTIKTKDNETQTLNDTSDGTTQTTPPDDVRIMQEYYHTNNEPIALPQPTALFKNVKKPKIVFRPRRGMEFKNFLP